MRKLNRTDLSFGVNCVLRVVGIILFICPTRANELLIFNLPINLKYYPRDAGIL